MGLFSKLKANFNHGGVKVDFQAAGTIHLTDQVLPVTVVVNATEQPQTINRVSAEIIAESRNQNFNTMGVNNQSNQQVQRRTVARIDDNQQFSLHPGESRTIQLQIIMNGGIQALTAATGLDPNSAIGKLANGLIAGLETANSAQYSYTLQISADVAGIKLDPAKSQPLQILAPGQFGTSFNIQV